MDRTTFTATHAATLAVLGAVFGAAIGYRVGLHHGLEDGWWRCAADRSARTADREKPHHHGIFDGIVENAHG